MEKEFVHHKQALALKELGFDEPCFSTFIYKVPELQWELNFVISDNRYIGTIAAPTFSQAFRWFREKYELDYSIIPESDSGHTLLTRTYNVFIHRFIINVNVQSEILRIDGNIARYNKREEAELECLKKLIEIVKEKK